MQHPPSAPEAAGQPPGGAPALQQAVGGRAGAQGPQWGRVWPAHPAQEVQFAEAHSPALPHPSCSTCKADLLRVGSLDSEGSPLGATAAAAINWTAGGASGAGAAATPARAGTAVSPARGSAESSSSRLLDAPPAAAAEPRPAPMPEAAVSGAEPAATSEAAAAADGEAALVLPTQYLSELATANACLQQLPLPGGWGFGDGGKMGAGGGER